MKCKYCLHFISFSSSTIIPSASTFGSLYCNEDADVLPGVSEFGMSQSGCGSYDSGINSIGSQENMTPNSCASFALMSGPQKVSRKQKSLGLLCEKFISRFPEAVPDGEKCEIPLDDLAKQMCTERRRIYDIVNVLEAVQMMTKVHILRVFIRDPRVKFQRNDHIF